MDVRVVKNRAKLLKVKGDQVFYHCEADGKRVLVRAGGRNQIKGCKISEGYRAKSRIVESVIGPQRRTNESGLREKKASNTLGIEWCGCSFLWKPCPKGYRNQTPTGGQPGNQLFVTPRQQESWGALEVWPRTFHRLNLSV